MALNVGEPVTVIPPFMVIVPLLALNVPPVSISEPAVPDIVDGNERVPDETLMLPPIVNGL